MSDHVIGIVAKITSKPAGKNDNLIYNVCIEEDGRDDEWYGYGWDEPDFTEGAEIEFDISYNGDYANIDPDTVNVLQDGEPKRKSNSRSGGSRSGSGGRSSGRSSSRSSSSSSRGNSRGKPSNSRGGNSSSRSSGNATKGKGAADTSMSKEEWKKKDNMIRRQACMNTAIALVGLFHTAGVLPKPTKKSEGLDAIAALCDEEAIRLYDQYEEQVHGGGEAKRGQRSNNQPEYDDDIPD